MNNPLLKKFLTYNGTALTDQGVGGVNFFSIRLIKNIGGYLEGY